MGDDAARADSKGVTLPAGADAPRAGSPSAGSPRRSSLPVCLPQLDPTLQRSWRKSLEDRKLRRHLVQDLLGNLPLFKDTSEDFRVSVARELKPFECHENDVIFQQGEPGDWAGILMSGRLE